MPPWANTHDGALMNATVLPQVGANRPSSCFTIKVKYSKRTLSSPESVLVQVNAAGLNRVGSRSRNGGRAGVWSWVHS